MKTLQKIERKKGTWIIFAIIFIFFLLRLPSLIEPLWYGDEGIYEVVGMALNHCRLLYSQVWDNKPPLLYVVYAIAHADQYTVRLFSLISGILSIIPFYFLTRKLFNSDKISLISLSVFVFLFATPFLEGNIANAENFMLLPIITAAFLVFRTSEIEKKAGKFWLFTAGILLGTAFLFKIVALFDFIAFFVFLIFYFLPEKLSGRVFLTFFIKHLHLFIIYLLGFLFPILVTIFYFLMNGILGDFINATFFGNIGYVGYANKFIIPQGFLILKLIFLIAGVLFILWKRRQFGHPAGFILLWFLFSLFNALFSGRVWTHYLLVLMPSAVLLLGLFMDRKAGKLKLLTFGLLLLLVYFSVGYFKISIRTFTNTYSYYQNYLLFLFDKKSVTDYQEYFDRKVTRDYAIAQFITKTTKPEDNIFIWGNNPQIYVLSNKLPPGKYTVEYHINQNQKSIDETAEDINKSKPKYVIILPEIHNFPFSIGSSYAYKFNIKGADIYERTF